MAKPRKTKPSYASEEAQLETAFRNCASPRHNKNSASGSNTRNTIIIVICIALVAITLALLTAGLYFYNEAMNTPIPGNITVAGIKVSGMTYNDAINAVTKATQNTYGTNAMTVTVLDTQIEIPPSCCQNLDVKSAIKAAWNIAKKSDSGSGAVALDLTPYLTINTDAIRQKLDELGAHYNSTLKQSTYEVIGTKPQQSLVVHIGTPEYGLNMEVLYTNVLEAYSANEFSVQGECSILDPEPVDLDAIHAEHYVAPTDASYNDKFEVIDSIDGYGFDLEAAKNLLQQAGYGQTVEIPFHTISANVTAQTLADTLYRDELGTYTASSLSNTDRDTNLRLACEAINGMILYPGDVFSYNAALGERTAERGYRPGDSYDGDRTVKTYGGGICQVSSSLYYCVLLSDLEVLNRGPHTFASSYMPLGLDAAVNWGTLDFRFRNNSDYPIKIVAEASGGSTTVTLMGTDTKDYYIELEYEVLSTFPYSTSYKEMPADNEQGYRNGDVITTPYTGYSVKSYQAKYNKETKALISKDYITKSTYKTRNEVICKITDGAAEQGSTTPESVPGIGNGSVTDSGALPPELP